MKKLITIISTILILVIIGIGTYTLFFKEDKNSTLTIIEKQWIEDNKNNIIDLGIVNNIPVFNYNGEGIIFDFVDDIEEKTDDKAKPPCECTTALVHRRRFELPTPRSEAWCSIH